MSLFGKLTRLRTWALGARWGGAAALFGANVTGKFLTDTSAGSQTPVPLEQAAVVNSLGSAAAGAVALGEFLYLVSDVQDLRRRTVSLSDKITRRVTALEFHPSAPAQYDSERAVLMPKPPKFDEETLKAQLENRCFSRKHPCKTAEHVSGSVLVVVSMAGYVLGFVQVLEAPALATTFLVSASCALVSAMQLLRDAVRRQDRQLTALEDALLDRSSP